MKRDKSGIAANIALVLIGIPTAVFLGYLIYSDAEIALHLRVKIHLISFIVCYPPYFAWLFLGLYKQIWGVAAAFLGIFIRLTVTGIIFFWLKIAFSEHVSAGLVIYLVSVGSFLLFEIVSLIGAGLHTRKGY